MTQPETQPKRYWLLDWFGHMVDLDVLRDRPNTTRADYKRLPAMFITARVQQAAPFAVMLHKGVSLPMPLPDLEARMISDHIVNLRTLNPDNERFMRSTPDFTITFDAKEAKEWERYALLSESFMYMSGILADPNAVSVGSKSGDELGPMRFAQQHQFAFGDLTFPIAANIATLEAFSRRLPLKEDVILTLETPDGAESVILSPK